MKNILVVAILAALLASSGVAGSTSAGADEIWRPAPGTTWQWQLGGNEIDTSFDVDAYDVDGFETGKAAVDRLHADGSRVICYISVGSWENWRPDKGRFPKRVIGDKYHGWPGERWLDIRRLDVLGPIMESRLDMCAAKGFDAIEPDNMDSYHEKTGFDITASDQLRYNRWLAAEAHERGMSIAMKNNEAQIEALLPHFDFAITEDCFHDGWCSEMKPFVQNDKAVLAAEYTDTGITRSEFCPRADRLNFDAILKKRNLGPWRRAC